MYSLAAGFGQVEQEIRQDCSHARLVHSIKSRSKRTDSNILAIKATASIKDQADLGTEKTDVIVVGDSATTNKVADKRTRDAIGAIKSVICKEYATTTNAVDQRMSHPIQEASRNLD